MANNRNSGRPATAEELSDDTLGKVTGGKAAGLATIGIVREPTRHPVKVVVPD
jgi:hypothetical protein